MNKQKLTYLSPETETLVVRFEESVLTVSNGVNYSNTPGGAGGNDLYDDGDDF